MNNVIKRLLMEELKKLDPDVELISREVVVSLDFLKFRSTGRVLDGDYGFSLGEFLLYHLLSEEDRKNVFSCKYDLGNPSILDKKEARQGPLVNHLSGQDLGVEIPENINDIIKKLKKVITCLTGFEFSKYKAQNIDSNNLDVNTSYAVKTLCTLFRYRCKSPRLFARFIHPKSPNKANLELRDAHPLKWHDNTPEQGVVFFSDLKLSLTQGMNSKDAADLVRIMKRVADRAARSYFHSGSSLAELQENDEIFIVSTYNIDTALPSGNRTLPERADKAMYVALSLLEIEHKLVAKNYINQFLLSSEACVPEFPNLSQSALHEVFGSITDYPLFKSALETLLDRSFTDKEYESACKSAEALKWFVHPPYSDDPYEGNDLEKVAMLLSCLGRETEKIEIKAYWYGKENTSDRPAYYLQSANSYDDLWSIPEFYQEYWFRRYNLVLSRLLGIEEIWHKYNQWEQYELQKLIEVFQTNEYSRAIRLVNQYFDTFPAGFRVVTVNGQLK